MIFLCQNDATRSWLCFCISRINKLTRPRKGETSGLSLSQKLFSWSLNFLLRSIREREKLRSCPNTPSTDPSLLIFLVEEKLIFFISFSPSCRFESIVAQSRKIGGKIIEIKKGKEKFQFYSWVHTVVTWLTSLGGAERIFIAWENLWKEKFLLQSFKGSDEMCGIVIWIHNKWRP